MSIARKRHLYVLFLMFFGGLGGMLYGYDIGVISGALLFMNKQIALSTEQISLIVGAVLGGGAFATLVTGVIADAIGRKKSIIISSIIFIIGVLILVTAHDFYTALMGRLIQGFGIGMQIIVLPLYLAETAPPEARGRNVTLFQLFLTFGIVLAYVINIFFAQSEDWRAMFMCVLVPGAALLICSLFAIESPRWAYMKRGGDAAFKLLCYTRDASKAKEDVAHMQGLHRKHPENFKFFKVIGSAGYLKPFLIALAVACLNQLTGINSFLQFGTLILKETGLSSNLIALLGTAGIGMMNLLATIVAISLIDKVGRKPLLSIGTGGIVVSLAFLGIVTHVVPTSPLLGYLVFAGLIGFILSFAIGPGVVVWLALSELMPTRIRSSGMSICLFVNSGVSAILASVFLVLVQKIGISGVFFMCASFTFLYFLIARLALPETKNKSLEEIEEHFVNKA